MARPVFGERRACSESSRVGRARRPGVANAPSRLSMERLWRLSTARERRAPRIGMRAAVRPRKWDAPVWMLSLAPGGRIGFHRHVLGCFRTATCDGRARSHYADGRVVETECAAGETCYFTFNAGEETVHGPQNIGADTLSFVTVEFKNGANAPQPLGGAVS